MQTLTPIPPLTLTPKQQRILGALKFAFHWEAEEIPVSGECNRFVEKLAPDVWIVEVEAGYTPTSCGQEGYWEAIATVRVANQELTVSIFCETTNPYADLPATADEYRERLLREIREIVKLA